MEVSGNYYEDLRLQAPYCEKLLFKHSKYYRPENPIIYVPLKRKRTFKSPIYWNDVQDYCEGKKHTLPMEVPEIHPGLSVYQISEDLFRCILFLQPSTRNNSISLEKIRISTPIIQEEDISRLEEIGSGQYGTVYRALFRHHNVAAKVLLTKPTQLDDDEIEKLKLEAEILR